MVRGGVLGILLVVMSDQAAAAARPTFRYTVHFPAPQTHYAEVEAEFPVERSRPLDLFMAVWTPGSYLVREFARNIEDLAATGEAGQSLEVRKTRKNRWQVAASESNRVTVRYRVYCHEMSVRTNWVDERFALLNGAATFLSIPGELNAAHEVTLTLPGTWSRVVTAMPSTGSGTPNRFLASDYDNLVDSPILAGTPSLYEFTAGGKPHVLANEDEGGVWDGQRAAAAAREIVETNLNMWGALPYDRYVFLNLLTEGGGGLEHKNSSCLMASRWAMRTRPAYLHWLTLLSHEYFHVWNVKRLRPAGLGPFDYENENYTTGLWVAEGFTEYYGSLNVRRAGLSTLEEYLASNGPGQETDSLSGLIESLQKRPGRLEQPVANASYDAWIKLYRPDENSVNTSISYYTKGAVIAWLLDAKIRRATRNVKSLDDVMRLAYERYSGPHGYTDASFRKTAADIAGVDLEPWFHDVLETTKELDYAEALDWFGLDFKAPNQTSGKAWLGADTRITDGRLIVTQVPRGTPAYEAGFSPDDEILAIGDYRVRPDQWTQRMEQYRPGDRVSVLVARRERLVRVEATLGQEPGRKWQLETRPDALPEQRHNLALWAGARGD